MAYKEETARLYEYLIVDPTGNGKDELIRLLQDKYYIISYTKIDNLIHYVLERVDYSYPEEAKK